MRPLLRKKMRIGKYSIPLLPLLFLIAVSVVVASTYIILQFTLTMNTQPYPKVTFLEWNTNQKRNTFDYSVNIFSGIKTVDENITHGVFNDDSAQHQCYLRIKSLTNSANIAKLNITIYNSTDTIFTKEWTEFGTLPTMWEPLTIAANAKYAISIEITAAASLSGSSTFVVEIKENNP